MARLARFFGVMLTTLVIAASLVSSSAAAGSKKLVEGTLYNTSCGAACTPCPPPCEGPIPAPQSKSDYVCAPLAKRQIVCPLATRSKNTVAPDFCVQGEPCGVDYPVYTTEGAIVHVRKRGSGTVLASLPVAEGHFKIRLAPGEYVIHPYVAEESCWHGVPTIVKVTAKLKSPVPAPVDVGNSCVAHPDTAVR